MSYLKGIDLCQQVIDKSERKQGLEYSLKKQNSYYEKDKINTLCVGIYDVWRHEC